MKPATAESSGDYSAFGRPASAAAGASAM